MATISDVQYSQNATVNPHGSKKLDGRGGGEKEEGEEAITAHELEQSSLDGTDLFFLF